MHVLLSPYAFNSRNVYILVGLQEKRGRCFECYFLVQVFMYLFWTHIHLEHPW